MQATRNEKKIMINPVLDRREGTAVTFLWNISDNTLQVLRRYESKGYALF